MNFGVFDRTNGHCVFARSTGNGPPEVDHDEQYLFMSTTYSVQDMMNKLEFNGVEVVEKAPEADVDPLAIVATWEQIKAKRNALEISPITLDNGLAYDYDQQAKLRFETALAQFENLPTLIDGQLAWKLADNTFQLHAKVELQAVYDELQGKAAVRAALLFAKAEELAAGAPTVGDLEGLSTWGL